MVNLLEKAKKYPITRLYKGDLRHSGKALFGLCPFHQDSKPSFAIYPETNSYYCFTEGKGGDVVQYYQLLKKVDFKTAVKELT